jgi:hypothetical protein
MSTPQSPENAATTAAPGNRWDGKTLLFRADNTLLPGQVYVRPADGSIAEHALRGETPGSRYPVALRLPIPDAQGNDFALHFEAFEEGPVCLETDAALIDAAVAAAGGDVTASARDASALILTTLSDAPDAPVTLPKEPEVPEAPAPDPAKDTPAAPVETVPLTKWHHSRLVEWLAHVPSYLKVGYHEVLAEIEKL